MEQRGKMIGPTRRVKKKSPRIPQNKYKRKAMQSGKAVWIQMPTRRSSGVPRKLNHPATRRSSGGPRMLNQLIEVKNSEGKVDYHSMGNMEQHLANSTSTTLLHQLRDLWKSPRGIVLRIEALVLVAIALSFFLTAFGSCRRWSNRWILQKGFLAANSLCLSLGTYSIGLMQSSSVKSEMHPFWSVSLLTLFGCVDPVTSYSLDYKSQLWKMLYQIFLYCGYVLLISISTISSEIGNVAIGVLSTITFIKVFHRSLVFVLPIRIHGMTRLIETHMRILSKEGFVNSRTEDLHGYCYVLGWYHHKDTKCSDERKHKGIMLHVLKWRLRHCHLSMPRKIYDRRAITIDEIWQCNNYDVRKCRDVCLSYSLSNLLQRRFFGLECAESDNQMTHDFVFKGLLHKTDDGVLHYKRAFKVIEVELAFLYDTFFTSNRFLRLGQAEAASIWAFASVIGICFVGVVALNPSMRNSSHNSGDTIVVNTTTADLIITVVILVFLVLLQVSQLIRCWTSNWARVSFVFSYMVDEKNGTKWITPWMRLKAYLTRIKCFDNCLWQNKLGQYSFVESTSRLNCNLFRHSRFRGCCCEMFGFPYIAKVLRDMFDRETGHSIVLHDDVKESIAVFLYRSNDCRRSAGSTFLKENGLCSTAIPNILGSVANAGEIDKILIWHIGTCYCELAQRKKGFCCIFRKGNEDFLNEEEGKYHGVATALSKYYAYLLVSAPQLVCKDFKRAKSRCKYFVNEAREYLGWTCNKLEAMRSLRYRSKYEETGIFRAGVQLGQQLEGMPHRWKILADFWVEALLRAAPSDDNAEEHMRHLSQGGEFITHLWALLSHAGILKRQPDPEEEPGHEQHGGEDIV